MVKSQPDKKKKLKVDNPTPEVTRPNVKARTKNQKDYIKSIEQFQVTLCIGPAGCGKSHIATGMALCHLFDQKVERVVITRPVVESGERLGFLPGSSDQKLNPYIRPVWEEMLRFFEKDKLGQWKAEKKIEIIPLAHMRGLNFHNTFIVADECQNATEEQLMMLCTRLGDNSKLIINGDLTQEDLPRHQRGGLELIFNAFKPIQDEIGLIQLEDVDIVRNPLVAKMINAIRLYKDN